MWFVNIQTDDFTFYYNMEAEVNKAVVNEIGQYYANKIYRNREARHNIKQRGYMPKRGSAHLGMMGAFNYQSQQMELISALSMAGIYATVSKEIAELVLERAKYYCPVETGYLRDSGCIEDIGDNKCIVKFDCNYAWYVHEYTWKKHKYPTCAKFLTIAVQEVETWLEGLS